MSSVGTLLGWLRGAAAVGGAAVLLVCASRVVLAEHWLVDVVAGVVAAVGAGLLAAAVLDVGPPGPDPDPDDLTT